MQTLLLQNTLEEGGMRVEREKKSCLLLQPVDLDSPSGKGNEGDGRKESSKGSWKQRERNGEKKRGKQKKEREGSERASGGGKLHPPSSTSSAEVLLRQERGRGTSFESEEEERRGERESQQQKPHSLLFSLPLFPSLPFHSTVSQLIQVWSEEWMV